MQVKLTPELEISEHGFLNDLVFFQNVKGGLLHPDRTQRIEGRFYMGTDQLTPKLVLKFGIAVESESKFLENANERPKAIRFDNRQAIRGFVFNLLKAEVYAGRKTKEINPHNFELRMKEDMELVEAAYRLQVV